MAIRNPGKIRELRQILADLDLNLAGLDDFPELPEIPEDRGHLCRKRRRQGPGSGTAHESAGPGGRLRPGGGALAGRPGVFSARYAQDRTAPLAPTDADNWGKLLEEMRDLPWEERAARFVCAIALALPDGRLFEARGECAGRIATSPQGTQGFGYDPVFWVAEYGATMAQLGPEVKNRISHRARALTALREILVSLKEDLARLGKNVGA